MRIRGLAILVLLCSLWSAARAQTEAASLSGYVSDASGAVLRGAQVELTNVDTNISATTTTNDAGLYLFASVYPGRYRLIVRSQGFKEFVKQDLVLHVQDTVAQNFKMQIGSASESITVTAESTNIDTNDASVSTVVDRQFVANIPLNGRSFQSLISLTPGVIAVPGAQTGATGEFSVNGQRTEANYYTVDGVSANTGGTDLNRIGATPGESALGTTQSLVSVDALQEFRISTSTYSSEYGRMPGAQISFLTRSGSNIWHGSAFEYFRNDALDANNWFNDHDNLPKTAERQSDFGGTLGGPVEIPRLYHGKDKTFFFFSYEGLRLTVPQPAFTVSVPDMYLRTHVPASMRPVVDAFPVPNGPDDPNCVAGPSGPNATCLAQFTGSYSSPSSLDSYSIRVDQSFGEKFKLFGRYSDAPSTTESRFLPYNPSIVNKNGSAIKTATMGVTVLLSPRFVNELRFNYSNNQNYSSEVSDSYGGATPLSVASAFSGYAVPPYYNFGSNMYFGSSPFVALGNFNTPSHQWNLIDSQTLALNTHTLKFGIDYRKQVALQGADSLIDIFDYFSPQEMLQNAASDAVVETFGSRPPTGLFTNVSLFGQDEWKATNRLHLSLGLRWDVNPPPSASGSLQPYTLTEITDLTKATLAPQGTPLWATDYKGIAPRVGAAYQLRTARGRETVLRGGFGTFYDVGNFAGLYGLFGGVGFGNYAVYSNVPFPLTPAQQVLPAPSTAPPWGLVNAPDPHLRLPYTLQWNVALEQSLGENQTITLSYVASRGKRLLHSEVLYGAELAALNPNFSTLTLVQNGSSSGYDSLQAQYQRHLSRGLQVLASYTWAHSIDDLSSNQNYNAPLVRGNSDFDVRHNFNAALTYEIPGNYSATMLNAILKNWGIDVRQSGRSALPVDVYSGYGFLPTGGSVYLRPNLVPGKPLYLSDPTAPGGRVINIHAFAPASSSIGDEPRNFLRGFDAWQTDLALRREFPIRERLKLQFRAEAFNLFNHPNFGTIDNFTSDGALLFGRANSTLNNALGGLNPLYQMGGPRSLQLALKILF